MALEDDIAALSAVALFREMDRDALRLLAFSSERRQLRVGDVLFHKGDESEFGFVVLSGAVALIDDRTTVKIVGPGTLIGEIALLAETRRPVTAVTHEPASVLRISRQMFRRTLEEHPQTAGRIAQILRERLRSLSGELAGVKHHLRRLDEPNISPK